MNESRLKKRAELRRRIAYMQGGSEGAEPNTYKSEQYSWDHDKQMHQDANLGGDSGMVPGDSEVKEKLSRAELKERRLKRMAYMQGGSEGREPNTYKSEQYSWDHDKQMHQTGNMGGDSGMFPGDSEAKEKVSRAAYNGPALSTRFLVKRSGAGSVDRANSVFQVFAGDKKVIQAKASEIFGPELNDNWDWLRSREYGKEVCSQIREAGLATVSSLLKSAQDLELEAPGADAPADAPPMDMPEAPPMDMPEAPPMDDAPLGDEEAEEEDPAAAIDGRLSDMERMIDEVRDLVDELQDQRMADVDVNVFTGKDKGEEQVESEMTALSSQVLNNLKVAFAKLDSSADELAMVGETYDNISKLSSAQAKEFRKLAGEAVRDADQISGEVKGLVSVAMAMKEHMGMDHMVDAASYAEDAENDADCMTDDAHMAEDEESHADDGVGELVAAAMELRKNRREALLKQAEDRVLASRKSARENLLKSAGLVGDMWDSFTDWDAEQLINGVKTVVEAAGHEFTPAHKQRLLSECDPAQGGGFASCGALAAELAGYAVEDLLKWLSGSNAEDSMANEASDMELTSEANKAAEDLKVALASKMKKAEEDDARESYRVKLRRAYDVGLDMQRKGLLPTTKTALDKQVDEIMDFDDRAFESFKRSIASARPVKSVKIASDLGGVNIGVEDESSSRAASSVLTADALSNLWD